MCRWERCLLIIQLWDQLQLRARFLFPPFFFLCEPGIRLRFPVKGSFVLTERSSNSVLQRNVIYFLAFFWCDDIPMRLASWLWLGEKTEEGRGQRKTVQGSMEVGGEAEVLIFLQLIAAIARLTWRWQLWAEPKKEGGWEEPPPGWVWICFVLLFLVVVVCVFFFVPPFLSIFFPTNSC